MIKEIKIDSYQSKLKVGNIIFFYHKKINFNFGIITIVADPFVEKRITINWAHNDNISNCSIEILQSLSYSIKIFDISESKLNLKRLNYYFKLFI